MNSSNHRFVFLDGMRGLAAIAVVCMHLTNHNNHVYLFPSASMAVDLFFCLSGFVIAWSYSQKLRDGMRYSVYIKKRLIRLYPMFLIGSMLGIIALVLKVHLLQTSYTLNDVIKASFLNIFYLPFFNSGYIDAFGEKVIGNIFPINPPGWSLFFELVANLLFVFTIRFSKQLIILIVAILGVWLCIAALAAQSPPGWKTVNFIGGFPRVGYSFMFGVLIYKCMGDARTFLLANTQTMAIALMVILSFLMLLPGYNYIHNYWLLCTLVAVPLLVLAGTKSIITSKPLEVTFIYLGWISYPLYCLHIPISLLASLYYPAPQHFLVFNSLLIIAIIFISHVIGKYLDEPFRAWLVEINNRRKFQSELMDKS